MPTLSSFSAINYNLHVSVKILGGFLHVWNFRISVPLLQMSRRDMPRWAETTSAKAARGEVVRGPGSARWVKVEEVDGDGKKVTLGVGTKDMQMQSWRWEKAPTFSGEACTAAQRRLAEKEKMGLQRVQISATNVSFLDVYWCAFHLFRGQDHYTGVCRLLQASMHVQRRDMMTWMDIAPKGAWRFVITKAILLDTMISSFHTWFFIIPLSGKKITAKCHQFLLWIRAAGRIDLSIQSWPVINASFDPFLY